jgi:hypothetical protein
MAPRQNMTGHGADNARIVPVAAQEPSVSSVVPGFTLALTKASIDAAELLVITARRRRPERVSRYLARLGRGLPMTSIFFPDVADECIARAERDFRLIDFDDPFERCPIRIEHRSPDMTPSWSSGCHEMCCPEPCRQRQLGAMHRRDRGPPAAIETFMQTRSAFQPNRAAVSTAETRKIILQRRLIKNAAQLPSSRNDFWNSASDRALAICIRPRDRPIRSFLGEAIRCLTLILARHC